MMRRILLAAVFILASGSFLAAFGQETKIDSARAEQFRKLSPEVKQKLKERLERIRKLSPEDRETLLQRIEKFKQLTPEQKERIRKRIQQLPPERKERLKKYHQFAGRMGIPHRARPVLLRWLKEHRPQDLEQLRTLSPEERRARVRELMSEFHGFMLDHAVKENRITSAEADELKKLPFQERSRRMREKFKNHQNHRDRRRPRMRENE